MDLAAEPLYDTEPADAAARKGAQRAARSLAARVAKLHGAVPLPVAAQELLEATASDDFQVSKVVRIIETDPALTGRLIRQVNTALGGRARCASVTQAVTMLGVRMLRASALAASAIELFGQDEEPRAKRVVEHAVRTGIAARFLAPHCGLAPDEMYTAGLLQDVGMLMLLRGKDPEYGELLGDLALADDVHLEERKRYGFDHALLAGHVLSAWKLPHPLPRVVAWHHQPARAFRAAGQVPRMVAAIRVADRLARVGKSTTTEEAAAVLATLPEELRVLGFSDDVLPRLCAGVLRELFPEEPRPAASDPVAAEAPAAIAPVADPPAAPDPAPAAAKPAAEEKPAAAAVAIPTTAADPAPSAAPAPASKAAAVAPVAVAPGPAQPEAAPPEAGPSLAVASILCAGGALIGRLSPEIVPDDGYFWASLLFVPVVFWVFGAAHGAILRARGRV